MKLPVLVWWGAYVIGGEGHGEKGERSSPISCAVYGAGRGERRERGRTATRAQGGCVHRNICFVCQRGRGDNALAPQPTQSAAHRCALRPAPLRIFAFRAAAACRLPSACRPTRSAESPRDKRDRRAPIPLLSVRRRAARRLGDRRQVAQQEVALVAVRLARGRRLAADGAAARGAVRGAALRARGAHLLLLFDGRVFFWGGG